MTIQSNKLSRLSRSDFMRRHKIKSMFEHKLAYNSFYSKMANTVAIREHVTIGAEAKITCNNTHAVSNIFIFYKVVNFLKSRVFLVKHMTSLV